MTGPKRNSTRKDDIIEATKAVIIEHGVAGTTRRIADQAGCSLGSLTYYFDGLEGMLEAAFISYVEGYVKDFQDRFAGARTLDEVREALVALFMDHSNQSDGSYVLGSQNYKFRLIASNWIHSSRDVLRLFFDRTTTLLLDAMIEGLVTHRSLEQANHSESVVREGVVRLTPSESFLGPRRPLQ
ncbi:MAG: TetR/AcrR family transcriptional regulator [Corynebacterium pyruviciproducens]|uniref:TetR/AcrR family transcriptional regulator n=1 Tax=Corynebacterium pyruviciproducens TaxID=598660 RepID=UPI003983A524